MNFCPFPILATHRAVLLSLALVSFGAARADTFSVTASSDDGTGQTAGTLSKAIASANANGGGNIVLGTNVTLTGVMKAVIDSNITL